VLLQAALAGVEEDDAPEAAEESAEQAIYESESSLDELADGMGRHRTEVEQLVVGQWTEMFRWNEIAIAYLRFIVGVMPSDSSGTSVPPEVALVFAELGSRAVSVAQEILILLRSGFALGAHARWRALYETAVIGQVLAVGNRWTANRYRNHGYVRLSQDLSNLSSTTAEEDLAIAEMNRKCKVFTKRYGASFSGQYGWAAELTARKLGVKGPKFWHLEKLTDLSRMHDFYVSSHHDVHADAIGLARLRGSEGLLHSGARVTAPTLLTCATIDCVTTITETIGDVWQRHDASRSAKYWMVAALAAEIRATGTWATQSLATPIGDTASAS